MKQTLVFALTILFLSSCGGGSSSDEQKLMDQMNDKVETISVSHEVLDEMMQTLPSPIEIADVITKSKQNFKKEMLVPSDNVSKFNDKFTKALGLGAYGVDLGYINLNDRTLYVIEYLESMRDLAKDLKVDQFFEFSTLSELATDRKNVDSLIHLSTENFNNIDKHLRSQNRGDLSVLVLVGAWIEGLYMFNDIAKEAPSEDIKMRIGEQKVVLDNIYAILKKLENIEYYKGFRAKLEPLKAVYDKITITYEYHEPTMKEVDGQLIVIDNTKTNISITNEQLSTISAEINKLRSTLFLN